MTEPVRRRRGANRKRVMDRDLDAHRHEARVEDALFLLDQGLHIDLVAHRLGMKRDALEQAIAREKRGSS